MSNELGNNGSDTDTVPGTWDPLAEIEHVTIVEGCVCIACMGMRNAEANGGIDNANPDNSNLGVLLPLTTNPDGTRSITGNRNVDATLIGAKWGVQELTFSFPTSGSNYNGRGFDSNGVSFYHKTTGTLQQQAARDGFAQISAYTNLKFTEITETDTVHAHIRISQSADNDVGSAYGGFPSDTRGVAGDIWFGRTSQPYYDLAIKGTWGYSTMLHEIGHTMGLKHGHQDYTNSDLSFFFGTTPRFGTQSLTPDKDGQAWSLMTYTPAPGTGGFGGEKVNQPQTFMQYDIAALQYMYGANYTTNATDSVYTFSQTTGEMFINGVGQGAPAGNKILLTIWDGGGNDTIDASNYANGVAIDLRPGEFSTFDQAQLANHTAASNGFNLAPGNIAMALLFNNDSRSLIENAKGGAGNDVFIGNSANNILDGGAGSDTVIFTGSTGLFVRLNDTGADVIVNHGGETDTLRSIENVTGTSGDDTLLGNSVDNVLNGGSGGADFLFGGMGNDRLIGGGFAAVNTTIIAKPASESNLSIATAIDPQARNAFTLVADANITNSTTVPHATINATATGGGLEFYKVTATAGATGIFDIDGSSIDTWIELVAADGTTVLANNDDSFTDAGSSTGNSFLSFTFATAGTYYLRVGRWTQNSDTTAQPLAAGTTYTLHISLSNAAVNNAPFSTVNTSSATLDGGEGNDFLQGTLGNDTLNGGSGNDTASFVTAFSNTATGVSVDLNLQGSAQNTGAAGSDALFSIENLVGSQYADTLTGDGNDNVIEGGLGNDALVGGAGNDTASYAGATAGVTVSLASQGAAQNTGAAGSDTLSGFENLLGSAFNDSLTGDTNANTLSGGAGDDTLNPGDNSMGLVDLLDGGAGSDTASFFGSGTGITATLNGASDGTAQALGNTIATLRNIENLTGSQYNDTLTGDANNNVINGGFGNDILDGGAGNDTVSFTGFGTTAITVNLALTTAQVITGVGTKTLTNFENVRTGAGADNITGDGNDNIFFEGGGNDIYNGAAGSDTLDYSAATSTVTVNLTLLTAQNTGTFGGSDTITNMENVVGAAAFANTLTGGNTTANRLTGGAAVDFIVGGGLGDTLIGGAGNDVMFGDYVNTFSTAAGQQDGSDVLEGGAGSDSLVGGMGNDILRGGDGDDQLIGGIANGTSAGLSAVFTNDGGQDTFDGGEGTDIAYAYYTDQTGGIAFDLANIAGNSAITMGGVAAGSFTSIERIIFRGGLGNDVVKGGGTLDTLVGNAGDDVLDGWHGNDTLSGGLGNDTLIGGEGLDTATYVNSTAGVNVDLRIQGVAQNTGGEGTDTLIDIEYLTGSNFGDTLRGNDDFNLIIDNAVSGPAGQTDSLFGYGGNDSILVTRAAAAVATNVNMDGGDGDDFIELRGGTLSTALAPNAAGLSTATYLNLGATSNDRNLDIVTVDGGAGNDRIVLTGVASATVNAGSGNDIVSISMRGATTVNNYLLTLGAGADIIQLGVGATAALSTDVAVTARTNRVTDFQAGDGGDRFEMTDFLNRGLTGYTANSNPFASGHLRLIQSGTDVLLQVDRDGAGATNSFVTVFAITNGYLGGFTAFNFDGFIGDLALTGTALDETITGAAGNDTISGGDGNDALSGMAGNDVLDGGNGNDRLDGGTGADRMTGGAGDDVYVVDNVGDTIVEANGQGYDTVESSINFNLAPGLEIEEIRAFVASATTPLILVGNELNQRIVGNAGDNILNGLGGADQMVGGAGNDLFVVQADDLVFEDAGGGIDTVATFESYQLLASSHVEFLVTNDATAATAINLIGNGFAQTIVGNEGANLINGMGGGDVLSGLGGSDTYIVQAGDVVIEGVGRGFDVVAALSTHQLTQGSEVELLVTGDASGTQAINLYGNEFSQTIIGNEGNNILGGFGVTGTDILSGLGGNDLYIVDGDDLVYEGVGRGFDVVATSATYSLLDAQEIEQLVTTDETASSAINLTGNNFAQIIHGNAGANVIDGRGGSDTLRGGGGNDTFAFTTELGANNIDRILDFTSGADKIALDKSIFAGLNMGQLSADAFRTGTAAQDADDRIIYDETTGALFFDADGNGAGVAVQFGWLQPNTPLNAGDFMVI